MEFMNSAVYDDPMIRSELKMEWENRAMTDVHIYDIGFENRTLWDRQKVYRVTSRMRDILVSLAALALLWPVMLLVALLIVIDSPGASPIFVQKRVGRDGKVFDFYKFRSMVPNAEKKLDDLLDRNEMDGPVFKIEDDPRITRVGRFIRRTSIDELPQFINVLKGDMSLVGPRPGLPREVEQYDEYALQRLHAMPGLTCYWQIQPNRNNLSFDEWMQLDMKYIRDQSHLTDLEIIMGTVGAVVGMHGK